VVRAIAYDDGSSPLLSRRNKLSEKSGMHITAFLLHIYRYTFMEREKAWTSGQYWLADSRYRVLVIFMDLFLYQRRHSDSDGNTPCLFVYTRHFNIVFKYLGMFCLWRGLVYGARRQDIAFLERE
jgi:hypothetical protein